MHWPSLFHPCMFLISLGFSSSWRGKTKKNPVRWRLKKKERKKQAQEQNCPLFGPTELISALCFKTRWDWPAASSWLLEEHVSTAFLFQMSTCTNQTSCQMTATPLSGSLCCTVTYLSLVGEAIGADQALVELDRGLRVTWLVLVPEVDVEEPEPLRETFVPLKVVQEGPRCVALHVHAVLYSCWAKQEVGR